MVLYQNGIECNSLQPAFTGKEVVVALDTSKTNTAMIIGDLHGNIIADYEFAGNAEKDVLKLCQEQREASKIIFSGAKVKLVGIEDIVTKKETPKGPNVSQGMQMHMSRFKITAVFMSFIFFFQETFDLTPELIPNQTWKAGTLPQEFRVHNGTKGSLAYFKSIQSPWGHRTDDVTDAVCIYRYMCKKHNFINAVEITDVQPTRKEYTYCYTSPESELLPNMVRFLYNGKLSIAEHSAFISNYLSKDCAGYVDVPTERISFSDIYSEHLLGTYKQYEPVLRLVVVN